MKISQKEKKTILEKTTVYVGMLSDESHHYI